MEKFLKVIEQEEQDKFFCEYNLKRDGDGKSALDCVQYNEKLAGTDIKECIESFRAKAIREGQG